MPLPIAENQKSRMLEEIFVLYARYGFDGISMDEVAKQIKISKATLYKYFKSKEEIVREMVAEMTIHSNAIALTTDQGIDGVIESVEILYFKAVVTSMYSTSQFITDLQTKFPEIYEEFCVALQNFQRRFREFYEEALKKGYFNKLSLSLFGEQLMRTLPVITSENYLHSHQTTLSKVIQEYYRILLYQLLSKEYLTIVEQKRTYAFVDQWMKLISEKRIHADE